MAIKQDPITGKYEVTYSKRPPTGGHPMRLGRKGITSLAQAKKVERELIIELERRCMKSRSPEYGQVLSEFLARNRHTHWTEETYENYFLHLKKYTSKWATRDISTISDKDVREIFVKDLSDKSESHRKSMHKFIGGVFGFALEQGYITRVPVPPMKFRIGQKIASVLSEEQIKLLLERAWAMNVEWAPVWTLALYTGMRSGELVALQWKNVDFEKRLIKVDSAWTSKDGFKSTKSGDDRLLEIAPELVAVLEKLKLERENEYVLPRIDKWFRGEQARELQLFLAGLGLPKIRFHDLRASWATVLLSKGVEAIKVATMAGWKDLKTMQRYIRKAGVDIKGTTDVLSFGSGK